MRITTKILALTLAVLMLLTLAACGDTNDTNGDDTSYDSGTEQQETPSDDNDDDNAAESSSSQGIENVNPIGQSATSTFANRYDVEENATIVVDEVIRGEEALAFIQEKMGDGYWTATNPEDESEEYLIAKITFTLNSYDDGDSREISSFYATSSDGTTYPALLASMFYNDDDFVQISNHTIAVGETISAYQIFQVKKSDTNPMATYRNNLADNSDGLWFELY